MCNCSKLYKIIYNDSIFKRGICYIGKMLGTICLLPITAPVRQLFLTCIILRVSFVTIIPFGMAIMDAPLKCFKCGLSC